MHRAIPFAESCVGRLRMRNPLRTTLFFRLIAFSVLAFACSACNQASPDATRSVQALLQLPLAELANATPITKSGSEHAATAGCAISPCVLSIFPGYGSAGVPVTTSITVLFSEAMQPATISTATIRLTDATGATVPGAITYSITTFTATLTPLSALAPYSSYYVTVSANILSALGTALGVSYISVFTTGAGIAQLSPPLQITSIIPSYGAMNVSTSSPIVITFNQSLILSSITAAAVRLTTPLGTVVPGTLSYNDATHAVTFISAAALSSYSTYYVNIGSTLTSTLGVQLGTSYFSFFTTGAPAALVSAKPTILSISPTFGAINVPTSTKILLTFDQSMNPITLNSTNLRLITAMGVALPATILYDDASHTVMLSPISPLSGFTTYYVTIASTIASSAGVALGTSYYSLFTTAN